MKALRADTLLPLLKLLGEEKYAYVAIDEGQFYPDLIEFSEQAANLGVHVMIAALDATFQRKPFGSICELLPMAEKVTKLTAICEFCGKEASFSKRIVKSQEVELIGGEESYKPVCRKCFLTEGNSDSETTSKG